MVHVDWCLHPLEGIVLAAVLFALYFWVIRLRCHARKAQTFIFVSLLAVTICSFITLSVSVEADTAEYVGQTIPQVVDTNTAAQSEADSPVATARPLPRDISWKDTLWLRFPNLLVWLYAAGVVAVAASFVVQMLWYCRRRRESTREMDDDGVEIFTMSSGAPFSFFGSVFLPSGLEGGVRHYALLHEKCHIRHHHFLKLCIMLMLVALNWFNPFVWMFFSEMKMQQELEVDSDMLAQGVDRKNYQMSLLQVCIQNSRWLMVQSAFGAKSLKQRIIFMNKRIKRLPSYLRMAACMLGLTMVFAAAMVVRAQISVVPTHHPLEGCWTMDFTRPANSNKEQYPPFKQYAFYNHDTFFTPHFSMREGLNFYFGFSGEEVVMKGDKLVNAHGEAMVYRFVSENTFQSDWKKASTDNSLAQGDIITDQWSRATPPAEVVKAFQMACDAGNQKQHSFDGVWQQEPREKGGGTKTFVLVNANMMMCIDYIPDSDASIYRYSGGGVSTEIKVSNDKVVSEWMKATITMDGNDKAVMVMDGLDEAVHLKRVAMPQYIHRMLETTKIANQNAEKK